MPTLELQCVQLPKKIVTYNLIPSWLSAYCYGVKFCTLEACNRCFIWKFLTIRHF